MKNLKPKAPTITSKTLEICQHLQGVFKRIRGPPCSIKARAFLESYHTLWEIITQHKPILVQARLPKDDYLD